MGTFVRIVQGVWEKSATGEWEFDENPSTEAETVLITPNDPFEGLVEMIRIRLDLGVLTPVALTYQLPDWMLLPEGRRTPPVTLATDKDVETMLSVREYMTQPVMYVTSGPELVAKYQFLCRSPFKIGERSFLGEGVTEEEHHQAIKGSKTMLEMMFNEPQLLCVFRMALEIEMVYAPTPDEREEFPHLTVEDMISIQEGEPMTNEPQNYNVQNQEVLHGQPMDVEELHRAFPNFRPPNTGPHGVPQEVQPLRTLPPYQPIWEEESEEEQAYWNGVFQAEQNHQVNVSPAPRPANGALGLPIGPNLRVSGPTTPNTVMVVDEDDASYTGSSDGLIASQNNSGLSPAIPVAENLMNNTVGVAQGCTNPIISQVSNGGTRTAIPSNGGPSLDLTLGIGVNNNHGTEAIIEINDSDSEADGESGGFGSDPFF
ncbi:unnamed protein product [Brassica rapa]|uniref:Uncharacterized protein n=1 Tax=Brassica campestris TaxID=3711 RepID=A0A3P5ZNZ1_BRACM|nr:unnamed protein product [Brassica rapa]VDC78175.1 unnamed protein product [Brassica rapa]